MKWIVALVATTALLGTSADAQNSRVREPDVITYTDDCRLRDVALAKEIANERPSEPPRF